MRALPATILLVSLLGAFGGMSTGQAVAAPEAGDLTDCPLLLEGQTSPCVALLQAGLNAVNSDYQLPETTFFGAGTRVAVLDFQGRNHLPADGNAGPKTLSVLQSQINSSKTTTGSDPTETAPSGPEQPDPGPTSSAPATSAATCSGTDCTGKYAKDTRCDAGAYTVKAGVLVIRQTTVGSYQPEVSSEVDATSDATGGGAAGVAGPAAGAAGAGRVKGELTARATASLGITLEGHQSAIGAIEVRYSPTCQTAWTRIRTEDESALSGVTIATTGGHDETHDVHPRVGRGGATPANSYYSPQIYVGDGSEVIGRLAGNAGDGAKFDPAHNPTTGYVTPSNAARLW